MSSNNERVCLNCPNHLFEWQEDYCSACIRRELTEPLTLAPGVELSSTGTLTLKGGTTDSGTNIHRFATPRAIYQAAYTLAVREYGIGSIQAQAAFDEWNKALTEKKYAALKICPVCGKEACEC